MIRSEKTQSLIFTCLGVMALKILNCEVNMDLEGSEEKEVGGL